MDTSQRDWSRDAVLRRLAADFGPEDRELVLDELDRFPDDSIAGRSRVQLAILQLAAGDLNRVGQYTDRALHDWRDVLFWADHPKEAALDTPEKVAAFRRMCQQFGIKIGIPDAPPLPRE